MEVRETYAGEEVPEGHRTVLYKNNNKTETSRSMRHEINKEEMGKGGGKRGGDFRTSFCNEQHSLHRVSDQSIVCLLDKYTEGKQKKIFSRMLVNNKNSPPLTSIA